MSSVSRTTDTSRSDKSTATRLLGPFPGLFCLAAAIGRLEHAVLALGSSAPFSGLASRKRPRFIMGRLDSRNVARSISRRPLVPLV